MKQKKGSFEEKFNKNMSNLKIIMCINNNNQYTQII